MLSQLQFNISFFPNILFHCHLFTPYQLPTSSPSLTYPPPPQNPLFPSFSTALPSLSIPQVHHTEPHCVSALGREHAVQPLWTHLRRPHSPVQLFHTHTPTHSHLSPFLALVSSSFHHCPSAMFSFHPLFPFLLITLPLLLEITHHQQPSPSFS